MPQYIFATDLNQLQMVQRSNFSLLWDRGTTIGFWERPLVAMGCNFYNVTYGRGVARRERRKRSNPGALSHAVRAIIPRRNKIKPESRRALTLPISEDSTPTHLVPSSSIARPTPLPPLSSSRSRGTGRSLTVVQFSASASLSRPVRMLRDRELVQKTRIRFTERGEKKVWIRVARTGTSAEIFFHGFSPSIAF